LSAKWRKQLDIALHYRSLACSILVHNYGRGRWGWSGACSERLLQDSYNLPPYSSYNSYMEYEWIGLLHKLWLFCALSQSSTNCVSYYIYQTYSWWVNSQSHIVYTSAALFIVLSKLDKPDCLCSNWNRLPILIKLSHILITLIPSAPRALDTEPPRPGVVWKIRQITGKLPKVSYLK